MIEDARDIGAAQIASWNAAFRGLLPDAAIDRLTLDGQEEAWKRVLSDPAATTFVPLMDRRIVGFATIRPTPDPDLSPETTGEIWMIYLSPEAWHRGWGRRLCHHALSRLTDRGFITATLWVLNENERAIAFYERMGFRRDDATKIIVMNDVPLHHFRFAMSLAGHSRP